MNRTGLTAALAVAAVAGAVLGVYPQLDLDLAALFFDPKTMLFKVNEWAAQAPLRDAATGLITALAAPAGLAILGKLILPHRRMLIASRAALFLLLTLAIGPGILANIILKEHWGRARPIDVTEFGGTDRFTPWWDPRGPCQSNCSFIAGEPSGAFWTLAPAALAAPQWRPLAFGAALVFGAAVGLFRMGAGSHFFSDVVFAGVLMFLVVWTVHGLIYRRPWTRLTDSGIEDALGRAARALRSGFAALGRLTGKRAGKRPQRAARPD
jgi:membrane-associated PAP2 superfamily phosphatase